MKCTIKMYSFVIDCKDPNALARFYCELMNWNICYENDEYSCVGAPEMAQGGYPGITFQLNEDYIPPVWPTNVQEQQVMAHLDFAVDNLEEAVKYAIECGATKASQQFSENWTVMLDPEGHPFCLCQLGALFDTPTFGLK